MFFFPDVGKVVLSPTSARVLTHVTEDATQNACCPAPDQMEYVAPCVSQVFEDLPSVQPRKAVFITLVRLSWSSHVSYYKW